MEISIVVRTHENRAKVSQIFPLVKNKNRVRSTYYCAEQMDYTGWSKWNVRIVFFFFLSSRAHSVDAVGSKICPSHSANQLTYNQHCDCYCHYHFVFTTDVELARSLSDTEQARENRKLLKPRLILIFWHVYTRSEHRRLLRCAGMLAF